MFPESFHVNFEHGLLIRSNAALIHTKWARARTISGSRERDGTFLLLVEEDIGTHYPGMVIDGDMDVFPA